MASVLILSAWSHADNNKAYNLQVLERIALERSPLIKEAAAEVDSARGARKSVRLWSDPEFSWGRGRGKSLETNERKNEESFELSQAIPWPGAYRASRRAAVLGVEAAGQAQKRVTLDVLSAVRREFYRTLLAQERVQLLTESQEAAYETYRKTVRRVELGESREIEKYKVHVEALRLEAETKSAEVELLAARTSLDAAVGGVPGETYRLDGSLEIPSELPTYRDVVARALEQNPEFRKAQAQSRQAAYVRRAERQKRFPGWTLSTFKEEELDREGYGFGFSFRVPLWNRNRGEFLSAFAEEQAALSRLEQTRLIVAAETQVAYRRLESEYWRASSYGKALLKEAEKAFHLAKLAYEKGETNLLDYLDSLRTYVMARGEGLEAAYRYHLAHIELQTLTGDSYETTHE